MSKAQTISNQPKATLDTFLREWLRCAVRASAIDRPTLCAKLTERLGRLISPTMLDTWTAETKLDWHIPADALPALCEILNDDKPLRQLLNPEQREALELGETGRRLCRLLEKRIAKARTHTGSKTRRPKNISRSKKRRKFRC